MISERTIPAVLVMVMLGWGCNGSSDTATAASIERVDASDHQTAPAGARLPLPLAVITKAADGTPMPRVRVRWDGNGGALTDSVTLSDGNGRAEVQFTFGAPGDYTLQARLVGNTSKTAVFTATAIADPTIASVSPTQFTGGDVLTLQGAGLSPTALVDIGGAPARITSGAATTMTVVVPVCLVPGTVTIRVTVNGGRSNVVSAAYMASAAPLNLQVGEYASIDPAQLVGCATFPAADVGGAEYLLAPQSTTTAIALSTDYRLKDSVVVVSVSRREGEPMVRGVAQGFHDFLRQHERELSLAPRVLPPGGIAEAPAATVTPPKVGDQHEFRVCNKVTCSAVADFTKVQAVAKYVGSHVAVFLDPNAPSGGFTDAEFGPLGTQFNDVLYDVDTRAFGAESDVDNNGIVYMLLTPVVNGLTPKSQCSSGVVTGFFFASDIDPNAATDARFNHAEIFYGLVPDPQGLVGCAIPKSRINQIVPTTFIHEFQHMISFNQHYLLRQSRSEDVWLNEAMSHLAEELGGRRYRDMGDSLTFSDFVIGDVFDGYLYLKNSGSTFFLWQDGGGTLAERGGPWLFLRWMSDKFGSGVTRRLEETSLVGTENIVAAAGEPFSRLVGQWFLANWVSDLPGFTAPDRLRYDSWAFRKTYNDLHNQQPSQFDRAYPIVPQQLVGGTSATGTLKSGSGDYFLVTQGPGQAGFTVQLTSSAGTPISTSALARLNVIRVK